MVAGGFAGGIYLWLHESVAALQLGGKEGTKVRPYLHVLPPKQPAIWLALGYDHRSGEGNAPSRSDTMMLLRTDPEARAVSMLSFPRDLQVQIHCPGHSVWTDKINAAYSCGQSAAALATVEALTGLQINYLITVDFFGFKKVVNILGGVWVDVDRRYFNNQGGPYGYATINLQPGYQKLTGGAALSFVRYRHTDSDVVRTDRQQQFVQELKEQFKQSFSIDKIPSLVDAVSSNVKIGLPGGNLSIPFLEKYGQFAKDLAPGGYCQAKINGLSGYSDLTTDSSNITAAVQQFMAPCGKQATEANSAALGLKTKTPKQTVPKPAQTSIVVLNGNGVAGAAADARYRLLQRGYHMRDPVAGRAANAPSRTFHTQVYYQSWSKRAKAAAGSLAQVMAPADVHPLPRTFLPICGGGTMLCIVVGTTYHNELSPSPPPPPPPIKHHPPSIYFDRSQTEPLVRQAQRSVPFRLLVPNVLESSSIPDTYGGDPPVRVYHITDKLKAVRLVFRRPYENEYWGIEETNWQDAPVLNERNFHREIGGRSYWFYYHGAHLHMVVLQEGGVGYWVVNTLSDSLSNETMIAIAKGLQPLSAGHAKPKTKK
jgi:LCP family protein required for cell wall assembly